MTYVASGIPPSDLAGLANYVRQMEASIAQQLNNPADYARLNIIYAAPSKVFEGMIVRADGTTWNPGQGAGLYEYVGGQWVKPGSAFTLQSKSAAYTLTIDDANGGVFHPASDNNARTFTIPANSSVAYPLYTSLTFINRAATASTIAITTDTLTWSPTGGTGSRTLAQYGLATAIKIGSTEWLISGTGLT